MSGKNRLYRMLAVVIVMLAVVGAFYIVSTFYSRAFAAQPATHNMAMDDMDMGVDTNMDMGMDKAGVPNAGTMTAIPAFTAVPSNPAATPVPGCEIPKPTVTPTSGPTLTPTSGPTPTPMFQIGQDGGLDFANPPEITPDPNGDVTTTLIVEYGDNYIGPLKTGSIIKDAKGNPIKDAKGNPIKGCPVHLRSYNGKLVGPTLRARPGDTLRITLVNNLPVDNTMHVMNTIGAFNDTNLHTHGLHVSPVGNSDNVLLDIAPQTTFEYEIKIPLNQVPGTYWYHAHMHGSTATQASSGMEGALIIMGDKITSAGGSPSPTPNNIDQLPEVAKAAEKIFVFQQIIYDEFGQLEPDRGPLQTFPTYNSIYPNNTIGYFGPCNWEPMGREHTINGQLFPKLTLQTGEVQRWRFIDGGVRETIGVELRGPYTDADKKKNNGAENPSIEYVVNNLKENKLNEIGVDGIALDHVNAWKQVELEPGYRSDVLVKLLAPGTYYLVDTSVRQITVTRDPTTGKYSHTTSGTSFSLTCPGASEQPNFLATIVVTGKDVAPSPKGEFTELSDKMGKLPVPEILKPIVAITTDKTVQPSDEAFLVPLETIDAFQKVDFTLAFHALQGAPEFMASDHPFDPQNIRHLQLNNTDEWVLNTQPDSLYYAHPFHIHINSFQTWRPNPDGVPELVWRDTLLVYQNVTSYVYTRYKDYIGAYVYHCHILDHEDQGMMEVVEVDP